MTETELPTTEEATTLDNDDDDCLDSFFAKKDKSKKPKKGKKKGAKSDESVTGTKSEKPKAQGDDWNDFEEEKEKDYSSLKIQSLQVADENVGENEEEGDGEGDDEDGAKKKGDGKWNVPTGPVEVQPEQEAPTLPGTHNVVGGKYVPPSVKRSNMMAMGQKVNSRKPMAAPDIQSKAAFPTLSAANQDLSAANRSSDFEAVKGGVKTREARVDENNRPGLQLGNRFGGLTN
jgi:hypothetical protein